MKTAKVVQLCRDDDGDYVVCPLMSVEPEKTHYGQWKQCNRKGHIVSSFLEGSRENRDGGDKIFGHLKLKPGEGPRKIEITSKFVD